MNKILTFTALLTLTGCQNLPEYDFHSTVKMERLKQLREQTISTKDFNIKAWAPIKKTSSEVRIYIEGDGRAWIRKGKASADPTPASRTVHNLMLNDPKKDIAYIARPCQYITSKKCTKKTWTFNRYDRSSVDSIKKAIATIKNQLSYQSIELIGYSGGATIALIIAAESNDVSSIKTVAGNLTPHFTNNLHRVSAMPDSLTPLNYIDSLTSIPQTHLYGDNDRVIPDKISQHYKSLFKNQDCITIKKVNNATHNKGWSNQWRDIVTEKTECRVR